jgi:small subunit ribosomal protein S13
MLRIAGVNLPANKHIVVALTSVYGIGITRARKICAAVGVDPTTKVSALDPAQEEALRKGVTAFDVEGDLRRQISMAIKRKIDLKTYAGLRHIRGLPVHGQRTHTNAKTRRGRRRSTGGGTPQAAAAPAAAAKS